jgi:hypothetical protein
MATFALIVGEKDGKKIKKIKKPRKERNTSGLPSRSSSTAAWPSFVIRFVLSHVLAVCCMGLYFFDALMADTRVQDAQLTQLPTSTAVAHPTVTIKPLRMYAVHIPGAAADKAVDSAVATPGASPSVSPVAGRMS